ncbi:MAG: SRPBCC family protein [Anaerolineales bacterium]|nr:SRPBCC family protein [Anaerolineales bacterium]
MIGFEQTKWIARTPEAVFAFITDAANAPKAMPQIKHMEKLTSGSVAVGTRYRETRVVNGKEHQAELEVMRFEPPQFYSMRNFTEGIETLYHYTFTSERGGTRALLKCELKAGGVKKLLLPVVAGILKKEDGDHLARLKQAVEAADNG